MAELTGGLIEMNAHMVRVKAFEPMLAFGIVGTVLFVSLLVFAISEKSKAGMVGYGLLTVAFAVMIVLALRLPMKKKNRSSQISRNSVTRNMRRLSWMPEKQATGL